MDRASTSVQQDYPILHNYEQYKVPATFLVITNDDRLLEISSRSINTVVENIGLADGSSVAFVDNSLYVVGGFEKGVSSSKVFRYLNFHPAQSHPHVLPLIKQQAPSLNSPKSYPTLIVLGSKLFAFSSKFYYATSRLCPESPPICEFLDTSLPSNKWCPLSSFPILPLATSVNLFSYAISSFSVQPSEDSLYLSFGHSETCGNYSVCYNNCTDLWTNLQSIPLPFLGEGKFVDDICFGFSSEMDRHDRDYITSYKVSVDWDIQKTFTWVALATFSLNSSRAPLHPNPYIRSFFPITKTVLAIVSARPLPTYVHVPDGSEVEWEVHELSTFELKREKIMCRKEFKDLRSTSVSMIFCQRMNLVVEAIVDAFW